MLDIWMLDVGHGDSIIVRYNNAGIPYYGLIDSCTHSKHLEPRALTKLNELGADFLSFVLLTHPHKDHYSGLYKILQQYEDKIGNFYSFPIDHYTPGRIKKICTAYKKLGEETDSETIHSGLLELVEILKFAKKKIGDDQWEEAIGFDNTIIPMGFDGVELNFLLPPSLVKGIFYNIMEKDTPDLNKLDKELENKLSAALQIKYKGQEIVLGGDCTNETWSKLKHRNNYRDDAFKSNIIKLPHHGSKHDCRENILKFLYSDSDNNIALISADGKSHPSDEVLETLAKLNVKPYCTGLAKKCGGVVREIFNNEHLYARLNRFINIVLDESGEHSKQSCQGDVHVSIDGSGTISVDTQIDNFCHYRTNLSNLFT